MEKADESKKDRRKFLSEKEIVFCRLIGEGQTPFQAAEQAGYAKGSYGERLMKQEKIQKAIQGFSGGKGNESLTVAENEEILKFLTSIMRGEEYEEKKDSVIKDRMRAAELLGKRLKLFENAVEEEKQVFIIDDIGVEKK